MSLFSLFCVVLVNPLKDPFPIDISKTNIINEDHPLISIENFTIGHLKILINKKKPRLDDEMKLWKVEELAEGNDKWEILEKIVKELNDETDTEQKLKELGARKLLSSNFFEGEFPAELPKRKVHIIVEPTKPTTTGKCLPMVYLSNKKFALSHIFFIRLGKRKAEDSDKDQNSKRVKLAGV